MRSVSSQRDQNFMTIQDADQMSQSTDMGVGTSIENLAPSGWNA